MKRASPSPSPSPSLNADVGEIAAHIDDGAQEALLALVDLANVACGGHAGDATTIAMTIEQCRRCGVKVGAHPSYPDRDNFGRTSLAGSISPEALAASLSSQIAAVARAGGPLHHVKAHGALYHDVARDAGLADAFIDVVKPHARAVVLPLHAPTLARFRDAGLVVLVEGFADRRYGADGMLVPRTAPNALIEDPAEAAQQARALADVVDTLCVHGDTPGALAFARAVRAALEH